jgi:hypothetical protein
MVTSRASPLQQLQQQRQQQRQNAAAVPSITAAGEQGMAGSIATGGSTTATAPGAKDLALLLAQGGLSCEVNRWDLVQRGTGDK